MNCDENNAKTFFSQSNQFPDVIDGHLIDTKLFLSACDSVVGFVRLLGTAFIPVQKDISGNIKKLNTILETDPVKYKYLNTIIREEKETLSEDEFHVGTDALQWLERALNYNHLFLTLFVADFDQGHKNQDLSAYFSQAYELSLKKYHNWFVQKLFSLCLTAAPSRSTLLALLSCQQTHIQEDLIFDAIKIFLEKLDKNLSAIKLLFDELKIQF